MKSPRNNFQYTVSDLTGSTLVVPFGESDYRTEWSLVDDIRLDYNKDMPSKIVFRNQDFDRFLSIENTPSRCGFFYIQVERKCSGNWVPWFSGRFILNDCSWDLHRCEVEVKLDKFEEEGCLEESKNQEINLFAHIPQRPTVTLYTGSLSIEKVTFKSTVLSLAKPMDTSPLWQGSGTPAGGGWVSFYHYWGIVIPQHLKETRWARQVLTVPSGFPAPGAEWILVGPVSGGNKYAKPVGVYDCVEEEVINQGAVVRSYKKECKILGNGVGVNSIDNGMALADVLAAFPSVFCNGITVKSEFFQINPDVPTTINYVTNEPTKTANIYLFQKSDVKRPNVSGNATIANLSWEKLMNFLAVMFNVRWRIQGTTLRIEHISWFGKNQGFNLTLPKYQKYVHGLTRYSYKTEQIPAKEEFIFMEAGPGDFTGVPILYTSGCVSQEGRGAKKTFSTEIVTTDVELCLQNPNSKDSIVDDKGFVLVAADLGGLILSEPGILSGAKLNNTLAWAQLQRDYHRHYRPLKTGMMNGEATQFLSVRPLRKGIPLTIPLCCDNVFNSDDTVATRLGIGTVEKATYRFRDDMLTLELICPVDAPVCQPPIAINDVFDVIEEEETPLDLVANDNPTPTASPITTVEIIQQPAHGILQVGPGTAVTYTPASGYTGPDNFTYRVLDRNGVPSNVALVAINVNPNITGIFAR